VEVVDYLAAGGAERPDRQQASLRCTMPAAYPRMCSEVWQRTLVAVLAARRGDEILGFLTRLG